MEISLLLGGYGIRLTEPQDYPAYFWPTGSFAPFVETGAPLPPGISIEIRLCETLPAEDYGDLIFDAGHGFWKLYAAGGDYFIETSDPGTGEPFSRSFVSADFSKVSLSAKLRSFKKNSPPGWCPTQILNPVAEVCLASQLARSGGAILHASAVRFEDEGWGFTGPSGAGKSTISRIFHKQGARILNDERIIVRDEGTLWAYGTPWPGTNALLDPGRAPLRHLFFIRHGKRGNASEPMSRPEICRRLVEQAFLPYWDRAGLENTFSFFEKVATSVPCAGLAFIRSPSVVRYLSAKAGAGVS